MEDEISIQETGEEVNLLLEEAGKPSGACGNWTWRNRETEVLCRYYCGAGRCPRQECKNLFWNRRVNRFKVALEYLHQPPRKPAKFATLTYRPGVSDEEAWQSWQKPWCVLRRGLNRTYGGFSFMGVLEKHKQNNRPHIHLVTNLWVAQEEWGERFERAGGGGIVWVSRVADKSIAEYVGKGRTIARYLGKENLMMAFVKSRQHTIFASRDVTAYEKRIREEKGSGAWDLIRRKLEDLRGVAPAQDGGLTFVGGCGMLGCTE